MVAAGAFVFTCVLVWLAHKGNEKERISYGEPTPESGGWMMVLHIRQDLKIVVFLLCGILIMLGVIADRIH